MAVAGADSGPRAAFQPAMVAAGGDHGRRGRVAAVVMARADGGRYGVTAAGPAAALRRERLG